MADAVDPVPTAPRPDAGALPLLESARILGGYRWLEARLFEVLGGWVRSTEAPALKVLLDDHAHQHAWHAELWLARLPSLRELSPDEVTAPPSDALAGAVDAVAAAPSAIERLVGVHRVLLPRLVTTYESHLARTDPVADGAVARTLRLILADEREAWQAGEAALQALLVDAGAVAAAADHQRAVEAAVVAAGGVGGPDRR